MKPITEIIATAAIQQALGEGKIAGVTRGSMLKYCYETLETMGHKDLTKDDKNLVRNLLDIALREQVSKDLAKEIPNSIMLRNQTTTKLTADGLKTGRSVVIQHVKTYSAPESIGLLIRANYVGNKDMSPLSKARQGLLSNNPDRQANAQKLLRRVSNEVIVQWQAAVEAKQVTSELADLIADKLPNLALLVSEWTTKRQGELAKV